MAMTISSTAEMKLGGRQGSTAPSDAAGKILGVQPRDPVGKKRFSTAVHYGYGTAAAKNPYFTVSAYLAKALGVLRDKGEIGTSRSPFSSTVTDSGTVTTASRWTSGYVVPGNGMPAMSRTRLFAPSQPMRYRAVTRYCPSDPRTSAVTVASSWPSPTTSWPRRISAPSSRASSSNRRSKSRLRERQRLHRGIGQVCEVHMHIAERETGSRTGGGAGGFEPFQQAPVAQQLQDLPAETAGLRGVSGLRLPLEYQRSQSGQAKFTSEH